MQAYRESCFYTRCGKRTRPVREKYLILMDHELRNQKYIRNNDNLFTKMEHINDEIEVNPPQTSVLSDPENAENNNLPADESVESCNEALKVMEESHTIPLVTVWCLLTLIYPIMCHVFDFVSDIQLTLEYFENQKTGLSSLTLAFTILPAIVSAWISFLMHYSRWEKLFGEKENEKIKGEACLEEIAEQTAEYGIILVLERAFRFCHVLKLYYAWRIRQSQQKEDQDLARHYNRRMLEANRNSAVIEVVEGFLQSAPQLILQLYVLLTQERSISEPMWLKIISSCITLYNFGTIMKDYHCAIREAQPDKATISEDGADLVLFWHLCTIAGRILVIGVAASNWPLCTIFVCVINWLGWTVWIFKTENVVPIFQGKKASISQTLEESERQNKSRKNITYGIRNFILASVLASVHTFTFINLREGRSFIRNALYYMLCLLQNCLAVAFSFILKNQITENTPLSKEVLNIISVIYYVLGMTAMLIYYISFHPSLQSENCNQSEVESIV